MVSRIKLLFYVVLIAVFTWIGLHAYNYFFSAGVPSLSIEAVEDEGYYCGDAQCVIRGKDDYKVQIVTIYLDNKLLASYKINKKDFETPFTIPTKNLSNGKHMLKVEIQNGTYSKTKNSKEISFNIDNTSLQAALVKNDTDAHVLQGRTLHVQFQVNKEIKIATAHALSKCYDCFPEAPNSLIYDCFIPIDCEETPGEYSLSIEIVDKVANKLMLESKFTVSAAQFKKQTLRITPEKVKEENDNGLSEKMFESQIGELTRKSPKQKLWHGVFYPPTELKDIKQITTDFGVIRATQHGGLRQHKAIDMYNTPKSVIWAPQNGIIVLTGRYAHAGNVVVIDHGYGLLSLLFHLDTIAPIEVGEKIKKGNPVGTLGKTGYATGYHIHWEMRLDNIAIDPLQWIKRDF